MTHVARFLYEKAGFIEIPLEIYSIAENYDGKPFLLGVVDCSRDLYMEAFMNEQMIGKMPGCEEKP